MTYAQVMRRCAARYLRACLERTDANVTQAARLAGVHRSTFYKLLTRYDIEHRAPRPQAHPRLNWPAPNSSPSSTRDTVQAPVTSFQAGDQR